MKKSYEKPVMKAEEFVTNAYCAACGEWVLNGTLIVTNDNWTWPVVDNNGDKTVVYPRRNGKTYYTDHTFDESSYGTFKGFGGGEHKYWMCTCAGHNGRYFLEYSDHHSGDSRYGGGNGKKVFYLYYDLDGDGRFDTASYNSSANGPWGGADGEDLALSRVTYDAGSTPVVNS